MGNIHPQKDQTNFSLLRNDNILRYLSLQPIEACNSSVLPFSVVFAAPQLVMMRGLCILHSLILMHEKAPLSLLTSSLEVSLLLDMRTSLSNSPFTSLPTAKRASQPSCAELTSPVRCLDCVLQMVCAIQHTALQGDQHGAR